MSKEQPINFVDTLKRVDRASVKKTSINSTPSESGQKFTQEEIDALLDYSQKSDMSDSGVLSEIEKKQSTNAEAHSRPEGHETKTTAEEGSVQLVEAVGMAADLNAEKPEAESDQVILDGITQSYNAAAEEKGQDYIKYHQKSDFLNKYGNNRVGTTNAMERRNPRNISPPNPILEKANSGDYYAIDLGAGRFAFVPRFGLSFQESIYGPGAAGVFFDCPGYNPRERYPDFRVVKPAIFRFDSGTQRYILEKKGELNLDVEAQGETSSASGRAKKEEPASLAPKPPDKPQLSEKIESALKKPETEISAKLEKKEPEIPWEEQAMVAALNQWWEEIRDSRGQGPYARDSQGQYILDSYGQPIQTFTKNLQRLKEILQELSLPTNFYTMEDFDRNLIDIGVDDYHFEPSEYGGWLWYQPAGSDESLAVPAKSQLFEAGGIMGVVQRLFKGFDEAIPEKVRFTRVYRPCRLKAVPGQPGKYKVLSRGDLLLETYPDPQKPLPKTYQELLTELSQKKSAQTQESITEEPPSELKQPSEDLTRQKVDDADVAPGLRSKTETLKKPETEQEKIEQARAQGQEFAKEVKNLSDKEVGSAYNDRLSQLTSGITDAALIDGLTWAFAQGFEDGTESVEPLIPKTELSPQEKTLETLLEKIDEIKNNLLIQAVEILPGLSSKQEKALEAKNEITRNINQEIRDYAAWLKDVLSDQNISEDKRRQEVQQILAGLQMIFSPKEEGGENFDIISGDYTKNLDELSQLLEARLNGLGEIDEKTIEKQQEEVRKAVAEYGKKGGYGSFLTGLKEKFKFFEKHKTAGKIIIGGLALGMGVMAVGVRPTSEPEPDENFEGAKTGEPSLIPNVDQPTQADIARTVNASINQPNQTAPENAPAASSGEEVKTEIPAKNQLEPTESQSIESQPSANQLQNATVHQGEGIEHALQRQLETNQPLAKELYKQSYGSDHTENLTPQEIDALSHRLAIQNDYVDAEGNEVRVNVPDKVAYVLDDHGNIQEKNIKGQILESDAGDLDSAKGKLEDYEYKHEPQVETVKAATPTTKPAESPNFFGDREIESIKEDAARVGDDMLEQAKAHQEILEKSPKQLSHEQKIQQAASQQEQLNEIIDRYGISDKVINEITVKDFLNEKPRILQQKLDPDLNWSSQEASETNERIRAIEKLKTLITENGGANLNNQDLSVNEFFQKRLDNARQTEPQIAIQETPIPKQDLIAVENALFEVTDTFKDDILNLSVNELIINEPDETAHKVQMAQTAYNDSPQMSAQIAELRKTLENIPEPDRHQESLKDFHKHQRDLSASTQNLPSQEIPTVQTEPLDTGASTDQTQGAALESKIPGAHIPPENPVIPKIEPAESHSVDASAIKETPGAPFIDPEKYQEAVNEIQLMADKNKANEKIQGLNLALSRFAEYSVADDDDLKVNIADELAEKLNEMHPGLIKTDKYHAGDSDNLEISDTLPLKETLVAAEKIIEDAKTRVAPPPENLPTGKVETQKNPVALQQLEALHAEALQNLARENPKLDTHIRTLQKDAGLKFEELSVRGDKIVFFDQTIEASDFQRISPSEFKILKAQHELVERNALDPTAFENLVKIATTPNIELKQAFIIENNPNIYKFEVEKSDKSKIAVFIKSSGLEQKNLMFNDSFNLTVAEVTSPAVIINFRPGGSDSSLLDKDALKTFESSLEDGKLPEKLVEQEVQKTVTKAGAGESLEAQASADLEQKFDATIDKILDDQTLMQKLQQNLDQGNAGIDLRQKLAAIKQYDLTNSEDAKKAESFARIIGEIVMKPEIGASPAIKKSFAEFLETLADAVK